LVIPSVLATDFAFGDKALSRSARLRWPSFSGPPDKSTTSCTASSESVEPVSRDSLIDGFGGL
jgi:hypothetical protein